MNEALKAEIDAKDDDLELKATEIELENCCPFCHRIWPKENKLCACGAFRTEKGSEHESYEEKFQPFSNFFKRAEHNFEEVELIVEKERHEEDWKAYEG
jgi:hypothetical protein